MMEWLIVLADALLLSGNRPTLAKGGGLGGIQPTVTPTTTPGISIESLGNQNIVGFDINGNPVGPTGSVYGQDSAMKIALGGPPPITIGVGVRGEQIYGPSQAQVAAQLTTFLAQANAPVVAATAAVTNFVAATGSPLRRTPQ